MDDSKNNSVDIEDINNENTDSNIDNNGNLNINSSNNNIDNYNSNNSNNSNSSNNSNIDNTNNSNNDENKNEDIITSRYSMESTTSKDGCDRRSINYNGSININNDINKGDIINKDESNSNNSINNNNNKNNYNQNYINNDKNESNNFNKNNYYNNNVGVQITFENLSYKVVNSKYKEQIKKKKKYEKQIHKLKQNDKSNNIDLEQMVSNENLGNLTKGIGSGDVIEKELTILSNVSGVIEKGEMTALFGPSGSGKSTLLDILAKRKSTGTITGKLLVNGKEIGDAYKKYCAYVTQEEVLLETSTVEETLKFHADLRLPEMSEEDKWKRVYQVLEEIGLTKKAKSKIGGILPGGMILKGLSGGQKKRVSIGCALVTNPSLLLLDEPTSGLDSTSALIVMKVLQNLTEKGVTVVCSIHQPRVQIFNLFTKIMVVLKGRMFYIGNDILGYLASLGYKCPNYINPADYCLDTCIEIGDGDRYNEIVDNWESYYKKEIAPTICNEEVNIEVPKTVSVFYQYKVLQERAIKSFFRNKFGFIGRIVTGLLVGLLFAACFGGLHKGQDDISKINGVLFFLMASLSLLPYASTSTFLSTRTLFNSERASKIYITVPFFLSSTIIELIVSIIVSGVVVIIVYTISNLRWDIANFFLTYVVYLFINIFAVFMVISVSNVTGSLDLTFSYCTGLSVVYLLYGGFFIYPASALPKAFGWLHYINPLYYGFAALVISQFKDYKLDCPVPVANDPTTVCLFPNGNDIIKKYGFDSSYQQYLGILILWSFFYYFLAYITLHYFNKEKR